MNPRKKRENYISSRKKRIYSIILIIFIFFLSFIGVYVLNEEKEADFYEAIILRVVDGDTIVVLFDGQEEKIRMIGVDAPESVSLDEEENSVWGQRASEYTTLHLQPGTVIWLTFDVEKRDQYGRLLAYVWLASDVENLKYLFQKKMLADGYAWAIRFEPNIKYASELYEAMNQAVSQRCGLWEEDDFYEEYYP